MKKTLLLILCLVIFSPIFAQAPESFKYQAVARDGTGTVLANRSVSFRISVQQGSVTGAAVYSERHYTSTNEFGLVTLEIGQGTVDTGTFATIDWAADQYFIKVEMDKDGGSNFQLLGSSQLLSVPYALFAKTAGQGDNWGTQGAVTDATMLGSGTIEFPLKIAPQGATGGQVLKWSGSTWLPSDIVATPSGDSGEIQFNNAGSFCGNPDLSWDNSLKRMGLGTNSPTALLTLNGGTSLSEIHFLGSSTGTSLDGGSRIGIGSGALSPPNLWVWNNEDAEIYFGTSNVQRMTLTSSGNLGIGTKVPAGLLALETNSDATYPNLLLTEKGVDYARIKFKNTNATAKDWTIGGKPDLNDSNSRLSFTYYNGSAEATDILSITGNGELQHTKTGDAHILPIAYGQIRSDGRISSGTGNFTCVWNGSSRSYEITIKDESYLDSGYTTLVTPSGSDPRFATVSSVSGKLVIHIFTPAGSLNPSDFQFMTYRQ